tara:strand:+ start:440 stop:706 length:267 start_codon:yes stop_codon:yes gene_type:complete
MVEVYTAKYCPFCEKAIVLLFKKGASFTVHDVTDNQELRADLTDRTGCSTIPQVFINNEFVGGCSDLCELDSKGELETILNGGGNGEE